MTEYETIIEAKKKTPHFQKTIKEPQKLPLVYQYRNFKSFWQILKSDTFWATNARFSNDEAEQKFGMDVISSLCNDIDLFKSNDLGLDENYIICFCREDDKLSQWRGYAPEGGVSMGFDFGMPRVFSVLKVDLEDANNDNDCVVQYVGLDAVRYLEPQKPGQDDEDYKKYCHEQIDLINPITHSNKKQTYYNEIQKKAPYIKHSGFIEEDEYRLVFRNTGNLDECVRYRDSSSDTLRYPYIVVKACLPQSRATPCVVRVCIQEEKEKELTKEIETLLKATYPAPVQGCHLLEGSIADSEEPFCTGCILRRWEDVHDIQKCRYKYNSKSVNYEYYLHESASCVVISQGENQKEIFEVVHKCVQEFNKKENLNICVWCEGHLPLRKITVGPCVNQENVVEAIKHYCKHTYWLKDVEIAVSNIPFRKSI